jgi:ABC-type multidrug transport system ATPase subunit
MGSSLSGGQRQRIALARAILRDPALLILDEATSAADMESEALIHKALGEFIKNRTTFVITHRLSTLEIADRIVVLSNGRIEAVGTHHELLKTCDTYQRLHEAHFMHQADFPPRVPPVRPAVRMVVPEVQAPVPAAATPSTEPAKAAAPESSAAKRAAPTHVPMRVVLPEKKAATSSPSAPKNAGPDSAGEHRKAADQVPPPPIRKGENAA